MCVCLISRPLPSFQLLLSIQKRGCSKFIFLYCKQQEAGQGPGNEAVCVCVCVCVGGGGGGGVPCGVIIKHCSLVEWLSLLRRCAQPVTPVQGHFDIPSHS